MTTEALARQLRAAGEFGMKKRNRITIRSSTYKLEGGGYLHIDHIILPIIVPEPIHGESAARRTSRRFKPSPPA